MSSQSVTNERSFVLEEDEDENSQSSEENELIVRLSSNYFQINLSRAKDVNCYTLNFEYLNGQDVYDELSSKFSNYEAGSIVRELFKNLLRVDKADGEESILMENGCFEAFVFDNYRNVYSTETLESLDLSIEKRYVEDYLWSKLETSENEINFKLTHRGIIKISDYISSDYVQFLHVLTWQSIFESQSHFVAQNKFFEKSENVGKVESGFYENEAYLKAPSIATLLNNDARKGRTGFSKDIIVAGKNQLFLQICPKYSLFYPNTTLFLYLRRKLRLKDYENLAKFVQSRQSREYLDFYLYGLKVQDRFTNKIFTIKEVTKKRAEKLKVKVDGKKMSIVDYYSKKFGANTNSELPCIVSKEEIQPDIPYYLFEHLIIVDYQQFSDREDESEAEEHARQQFCTQSCKTFTENLKSCSIISDLNDYLRTFGIHISLNSAESECRLLIPPNVCYGNGRVNFDLDALIPWKVEGKLDLLEVAKPLKWAVFDFDTLKSARKSTAFYETLSSFGKKLNLSEPRRETIVVDKTQLKSVIDRIESLIKNNTSYDVLIFLFEFDVFKEWRKIVKFFELETNLVTVCIPATEARSNHIFPVITKLMHKVNARTGGLNFTIKSQKQDLQFLHNKIIDEWSTTQFIGIHWRQIDTHHIASSIAYSVNNPGVIRGSYFIEYLDIESSERFDNALLNAVNEYREVSGKNANKILLYLQITKDDDKKRLIEWLQDAMIRVQNLFKAKYQTCEFPPFIIISVETDSCDALKSTEQPNVDLKVGTCLDTGIVDDKSFMLIQARSFNASAVVLPSRFTIVNDYLKLLPKAEAEYTTFYLCIHPVECKMMTLPLPLKAASDFTKRASENMATLKQILTEQGDGEPSAKKSRIEEMPDPFDDEASDAVRLERLNSLLKPTLKTYFCA